MPPRSSASAFDRLAPDQRAALELVLRRGRSYGELADLLGLPEETIRARARAGLAALAGDLAAPARGGE
ncbi:MAG TPA: sigma factor-like helix-turn-helix DNA-binding protein, partial [Solirubrobacter sp.]|nr:sigma factor-like helix-turn-helix DNA-binding protein [Solirubrobacter sp.]